MAEKEISSARLMDRATRILALRDHSSSELKKKLQLSTQHRGWGKNDSAAEVISQEQLDKLVAWCQQQGWLNDERFCERLLQSRIRKGYGPLRIQMELRQKGVDAGIIEQAFAALDIDWAGQAARQAERRFGLPLPAEWKEKVKVQRYLLARGFFAEDIHAIFNNFDG